MGTMRIKRKTSEQSLANINERRTLVKNIVVIIPTIIEKPKIALHTSYLYLFVN